MKLVAVGHLPLAALLEGGPSVAVNVVVKGLVASSWSRVRHVTFEGHLTAIEPQMSSGYRHQL